MFKSIFNSPLRNILETPFGASSNIIPIRSKLLLVLRPYVYGEDVYMDDISGNLGEDVIALWRGRYGEDISAMCAYMIPEDMQAEMFAIFGEGLWFDSEGTAKQVNIIELAQSPEINQWAVWYRLDAAAGLGYREVLFYHPDLITVADVTKIAAWFKEPGAASYPSAFFNGLDFRLATYTGGPTYPPDHLGVLRSPGSNRPAVQGMRLATTLADGAVLGPELITNAADRELTSDTGFWTKDAGITFDTGEVRLISVAAGNGLYRASGVTPTLSGRVYLISYRITSITSGAIQSKISASPDQVGPLHTVAGFYTDVINAVTGGFVQIGAGVNGTSGTVDDISIKEVIPTYITTDSSGNPIIASTPQKTVTYSTDWLSKTFAETFDKFDISDPLKAPGSLCEPVRTNKVTCRKSNPVDFSGVAKTGGDANTVWSVSSDTTALTSAGLIVICNSGKVYEVDNTLGAVAAEVEITNNSSSVSAHSSFIFLRGGPGSYRDVSAAWSPFAYTDQYTLLKFENKTPGYAGIKERINIPAGSSVRFILPQLEEGSFATSPICKASDGSDPLTSLTRSATIASFPTAGKIPVNDFAIRMIVVPRASGQSGVALLSSYVDSNNHFAIILFPTRVAMRKKINGTYVDFNVNITHDSGIPIELIVFSSASVGAQTSFRSFSGSWGPYTDGTLSSTTAAKANAQIASTYQLGALNGSSQFTGNISLFDCVPIPAGTTDPMAWAKTHWGVA